jgi:4-hydroxybenzoyl-CoA reductase subunit beta
MEERRATRLPPLRPPNGSTSPMLRLPSFTYLAPKTLTQALQWKKDAGPDGMYVAGGTDLYPNMKRRHQEPKVVISLAGVRALARRPAGRRAGGPAASGPVLGSAMTLTDIARHRTIRRRYPVVARGAELISTPLLRNMGTLGGNLCLDTRCTYYNQTYEWRKAIDFCMKKDGAICWVAPSSPRCWAVQSSDLAPVMVALDAEFLLVGPDGERTVRAGAFYHNDGMRYLTKQADEILAEVRLPAPDGWDATYHKLRRRGTFDFPVLGVAAWVRWNGDVVADARIVLGGVASHPQAVPEAAAALVGSGLEPEAVAVAAAAAFRPSKPMDNTDFPLTWRKEMTRVHVRRALEELRERRSAPRGRHHPT